MKQITGNDVIGLPGQNLTVDELLVLVGMAEAAPPEKLYQMVGTDPIGLRHMERDIQGKLGGRNKAHTITRGFITGVLIPRALCLMLIFIQATDLDHDFTRTRTARSGRTRTRTRESLC